MRSSLSLVLLASLVSAFSFDFTSEPQQCANLSLTISGSGEPPYSVLIIPYGPSPLSSGVEVRTIISQQFPNDASSLSFQLKYPQNSQFVAVVSPLFPGAYRLKSIPPTRLAIARGLAQVVPA